MPDRPARHRLSHGCLAQDRRGHAAVEFALLLPVLVMLFVGTAEAVSHLRLWYRLEQAAGSAADAGSRIPSLNTAAVAGLFEVARAVADPHAAWAAPPALARARTIVSAVANPGSGNAVAWTCSRGDASLDARVAGSAALPADFAVPRGQTVLVVEVVNDTAPWIVMAAAQLIGSRGPRPLRAHAIVRSRLTEFATLAGGCPA